jgi:hypothetical protein
LWLLKSNSSRMKRQGLELTISKTLYNDEVLAIRFLINETYITGGLVLVGKLEEFCFEAFSFNS